MSLSDFIGEDLKISYDGPNRDHIWGNPSKLTEEFPAKERAYSKFHKRMIDHFGENKLCELREIIKVAKEMYGYRRELTMDMMRRLWISERVRRFIYSREKKQARGVHYIFLPKDLWAKREMWGEITTTGGEAPSETPE